MMRRGLQLRWLPLLLLLLNIPAGAAPEPAVIEGGVNPGYHEPPAWFKSSFLDLREDVGEAKGAGKRLLLYFYQDGCPYCKKLLEDNFGQRAIAQKTRKHFDVVAINLWGDREVVDLAGRSESEKRFAESMKVMFTPTLLFLDGEGREVLRINGYYHPHKFNVALDYAAKAQPGGESFRAYLARVAPEPASGELHHEPYFMSPPYQLARHRIAAERPLLVLFEQRSCLACDELHKDILQRPLTRKLIDRFDVVQLDLWANTPLVTPDGQRSSAAKWAQRLGISYAPSFVFFDKQGKEVFRTEAYLKAFHLQSALDYVASGAYMTQPNFQRFVQSRADHLREQGVAVDLMQ